MQEQEPRAESESVVAVHTGLQIKINEYYAQIEGKLEQRSRLSRIMEKELSPLEREKYTNLRRILKKALLDLGGHKVPEQKNDLEQLHTALAEFLKKTKKFEEELPYNNLALHLHDILDDWLMIPEPMQNDDRAADYFRAMLDLTDPKNKKSKQEKQNFVLGGLAAAGYAPAQYQVAGRDFRLQDRKITVEQYEKAYQQQYPPSAFALGSIYERNMCFTVGASENFSDDFGFGSPPEVYRNKTMNLLEEAAAQNNKYAKYAQYLLARCDYGSVNRRLLEQSAQQGCVFAQCALAMSFCNQGRSYGPKCAEFFDQASKWCCLAIINMSTAESEIFRTPVLQNYFVRDGDIGTPLREMRQDLRLLSHRLLGESFESFDYFGRQEKVSDCLSTVGIFAAADGAESKEIGNVVLEYLGYDDAAEVVKATKVGNDACSIS